MSTNEALSAIAESINTEHRLALASARRAIEHARRAGELLRKAKAQCEHGAWLPWVNAHLLIGPRQAQKYIKLAAGWNRLNANSEAHLTIDRALALLASPIGCVVDPEFEELLPACSEAEDQALREDLCRFGVLVPFIVWKETHLLIDGYRRHRLLEQHPEIGEQRRPLVEYVSFPNRDEAMLHRIRLQLERPNYTPEQLELIRERAQALRLQS